MAITATDIITQFGAYYKDGGQGVKDLSHQIMQKSVTDKLFKTMPTKDTQLQGGKVEIGNVLQAFQTQFTPFGSATFKGRKIDLYPLKIDIAEYPDVLVRSWLGFLVDEGLDRTKWPFIKWHLEKNILPRAEQDWELSAVYGGVLGNVVAGTPLPASSAVNGIKKIINLQIAAGTTTPITLGATPTDPQDFVEYVEDFAGSIDRRYHPYLQPIAMGTSNYELFQRGMDLKYNQNYNAAADITKLKYMNMSVTGLPSHEGSSKIWTTVQGNGVLGIRKPQNARVFEIEKVDRQVKAYTDIDKGLGFWMQEYVFTNDVELT